MVEKEKGKELLPVLNKEPAVVLAVMALRLGSHYEWDGRSSSWELRNEESEPLRSDVLTRLWRLKLSEEQKKLAMRVFVRVGETSGHGYGSGASAGRGPHHNAIAQVVAALVSAYTVPADGVVDAYNADGTLVGAGAAGGDAIAQTE